MNAMARELQPDILINNRSCLPEDFGTPEESVTAEQDGRAWESCMTMNGAWGYFPTALDWLTVRQIVWNLRKCAVAGGNYLLNVGPRADGSIPKEAYDRLIPVGKWLKKNGEAVYGKANDLLGSLHWMATGDWTMKGKAAYYWCSRWAGKELSIGFLRSKVVRASFLATGKPIRFRQEKNRLILVGLPRRSPDPIAQTCVIKLECARKWKH
jgi:alpha-L-fucosidase